jgi:hypothetical protein
MELHQILAISSIGALYFFEEEQAGKLHSISVDLLSQVIELSIRVVDGRQLIELQ